MLIFKNLIILSTVSKLFSNAIKVEEIAEITGLNFKIERIIAAEELINVLIGTLMILSA